MSIVLILEQLDAERASGEDFHSRFIVRIPVDRFPADVDFTNNIDAATRRFIREYISAEGPDIGGGGIRGSRSDPPYVDTETFRVQPGDMAIWLVSMNHMYNERPDLDDDCN